MEVIRNNSDVNDRPVHLHLLFIWKITFFYREQKRLIVSDIVLVLAGVGVILDIPGGLVMGGHGAGVVQLLPMGLKMAWMSCFLVLKVLSDQGVYY